MAGGRRDREKKVEPLTVSEIAYNTALESFKAIGIWDNKSYTSEQMSMAIAKTIKAALDAANIELGFPAMSNKNNKKIPLDKVYPKFKDKMIIILENGVDIEPAVEVPSCRAAYSFVVNHFLENQFTGNIEVDHGAIKALDKALEDTEGSKVIFVDVRACKNQTTIGDVVRQAMIYRFYKNLRVIAILDQKTVDNVNRTWFCYDASKAINSAVHLDSSGQTN